MSNGAANQLRAEIEDFVRELWNEGLAVDSNTSVVRGIAGGQILVSWSGAEKLAIEYGERPSLREYLRWLEKRQYTVLLLDYSFLQITFILDRDRVVRHRLVYYPCPIAVEADEAAEFGIIDLLKLLDEDELRDRIRQESPLRFEFDPGEAVAGHSASHLHLSREECRIPVYAPLTLGRFIRFVFCHFYPVQWAGHAFLREWPCARLERTILEAESRELHLACVEAA